VIFETLSAMAIASQYAVESQATSDSITALSTEIGKIIFDGITAAVATMGLFLTLKLTLKQMHNNENQFLQQIHRDEEQFLSQMRSTEKQMEANEKINRARLWLSLREFMSRYDDIHCSLLKGGKWSMNGKGPETAEEWGKVSAYMGLFEHCNIMLEEGLIDLTTFKKIYEYRIENILSNKKIVMENLILKKDRWHDFLELCKKVGLEDKLPSQAVPNELKASCR
jgi:hypothetical protein